MAKESVSPRVLSMPISRSKRLIGFPESSRRNSRSRSLRTFTLHTVSGLPATSALLNSTHGAFESRWPG
jgi:hypothetical protein